MQLLRLLAQLELTAFQRKHTAQHHHGVFQTGQRAAQLVQILVAVSAWVDLRQHHHAPGAKKGDGARRHDELFDLRAAPSSTVASSSSLLTAPGTPPPPPAAPDTARWNKNSRPQPCSASCRSFVSVAKRLASFLFCQVLFYHIPPALKSITKAAPRRRGGAPGRRHIPLPRPPSSGMHCAVSAAVLLHRLRLCRSASSHCTRDRFASSTFRSRHKLPVADGQPHKAAIPGAQHFHRCRAAPRCRRRCSPAFLLLPSALWLPACRRFPGSCAGLPAVPLSHAPPGELVFHRLLGSAAAPEQHHGGLFWVTTTAGALALPTRSMCTTSRLRALPSPMASCRQQNAGHCHPRPDPPVVRQPPQPQQQQTDEGCVGGVKIDACPGLCAEPDGPAVRQAGQQVCRAGQHPVQRCQPRHQSQQSSCQGPAEAAAAPSTAPRCWRPPPTR